jgi:osmotically-inducible protein OsmY
MKRLFFGFLLGAIAGAGGYWYFDEGSGQRDLAEARQRFSNGTDRVRQTISTGADEMREKARSAGHAVADAAGDARTTGIIKARFIKESGLSALNIDVDTSGGLVTLSGTASSPEEVSKAVKIALDTEGVHKVISTIQIKASR